MSLAVICKLSSADAFDVLAKWREKRTAIHVALSRSVQQRTAGPAVISQVLLHSRRVLLVLRDDNGEDVGVTVSLEGAEWEYDDAGAVLPEFADIQWACRLSATFPNGNRYVFGERVKPR